eukprot:scaffold24111_cov42-Prasinocladus_malaysianus.AAC.1
MIQQLAKFFGLLFCRLARSVQLSTVSRATGTPLEGVRPVYHDGDNSKALVLASEVQSLRLPPGTAILVGPAPRYDSIYGALLSTLQYVCFLVYSVVVLAKSTGMLGPHLIAAVVILVSFINFSPSSLTPAEAKAIQASRGVVCFVCNVLGLISSLVSSQASLDDWQRDAFVRWFRQYRPLVFVVMILASVSGSGLDAFVMLGSHTMKALSAPWAQDTYTSLLGWSVVVGLGLQSIPQ